MYFGNSRVTLRKSANCDYFGVTDKTFVVSFINGWVKDDIFLGYAKECIGFDGLENLASLNYLCFQNEFCSGLTSEGVEVGQLGSRCSDISNGLSADIYTLENTFSTGPTGIGPIGRNNPFCTLEANWHDNNCACPNGYTKSSESFGDVCFKIFPIESLGLNFTDEINPCRFLFIAKQVGMFTEFQNTTVNIYYKTYTNGVETCNVATFQVAPDPCSDQYVVCWPPPQPDLPLIPTPDGNLVTPCQYCEEYGSGGGDLCYFEGLSIASSTCECPYTVDCYSQDWTSGSSGNCFFSPGITTTEPCVNGSWNGETCTQGYNDVCGSTDCVNKICRELDWFIKNYAGYESASFLGYSSVANPLDNSYGSLTGSKQEFWVSCGPTGVTARNDFDPIKVTFGETSSLRNWSNIVGLLNFWTKKKDDYQGVIFDADLANSATWKNLDYSKIGGTSCGWFYPTNLCCPAVPQGAFDYDCPFCGASGFTAHSPSDTSCCCAQSMVPIVFGLNGQTGFANAATGASSIGIQPTTNPAG